MDCLFCKIIAGEIPCTKVYEDDKVFAFRDINPQAPVHVLALPKKHMANILECDGETAQALAAAVQVVFTRKGEISPTKLTSPAKLTAAPASMAAATSSIRRTRATRSPRLWAMPSLSAEPQPET